jgi:hypothetical protein
MPINCYNDITIGAEPEIIQMLVDCQFSFEILRPLPEGPAPEDYKNYWNKYGILFDESPEIKKTIKEIEKKKMKGAGSYGSVYKVNSNIFKNKKYNADIVAVKIEKKNFEWFDGVDKLANSIKISEYSSKIKILDPFTFSFSSAEI